MKYILWPIWAILLAITLTTIGTLRLILLTVWHFRLTTIRHAYTIDGHYLFEDWSWKQFIKDVFIYKEEREEPE